jgi:hypothetical protein
MTFLHFLLPDGLIPSVMFCRLLTVYQVSTGRLPDFCWVIIILGCLKELVQSKIVQSLLWLIQTLNDNRIGLQTKVGYTLIGYEQ